MLSLVVFDLDGTLIDSKTDIANSVNYALQEEGFAPLAQDIIEGFVGRGLSHLIRDAIGNPSAEQALRVAQGFCRHYDTHLLDQTKLYPGLQDLLEKLRGVPMAVVTNKPYDFSKKILEGLKIDHYFRWLIGGDTLPIQKPNPLVFEPIFKDLGTTPKGLMIGDSDIDIHSGRGAGLLTCGVTYGFREREEVEKCQPDFLIHDSQDLHELPLLAEIFS